jgi:hypothetical protein
MRKGIVVGGLALALLPASGALAQTGNAWLHIRVEEAQKASKVHVNLPMTVVEAVLRATPDVIEEHGKVNFGGHHGLKLADCRRIWKQLSAVGDAEFVTVESDDENVRVQRKGDTVIVYADQKGRRAAKPVSGKAEAEPGDDKRPSEVRVEVPVSLVDALLSGEGDNVNLQAALADIQKRRGDIVRVHDTDANVRIWIDEQNTQSATKR